MVEVPTQTEFNELVKKVQLLEEKLVSVKPLPEEVKTALIVLADYLKATV